MIHFINKGGGTDTSDATAKPEDILNPQTAYVNGEKIEGNIMPEYVTVTGNVETMDIKIDVKPSRDISYYVISSDFLILCAVCSEYESCIYKYDALTNIYKRIKQVSGSSGSQIYNIQKIDDDNYRLFFLPSGYGDYSINIRELKLSTNTLGTNGTLRGEYGVFIPTNRTDICFGDDGSGLYYSNNLETKHSINSKTISFDKMNGIVEIAGNNCLIIQGKPKDTVDDVMYSTVLFADSTGKFIKAVENIPSGFIPSPDLKHAFYQGEIKNFYVDIDTGDYTISDLTSSIKVTEDLKYYYINWIANDIILVCDATPSSSPYKVTLYKLDFDSCTKEIVGENYISSYTYIDRQIGLNYFIANKNKDDTPVLYKVNQEQSDELIAMTRNDKKYQHLGIVTVTPDKLVSGETAYTQNEKIVGIMPNNKELNYVPSEEEQSIPKGYTSGGTIKSITESQDYQDCLELSKQISGGEE